MAIQECLVGGVEVEVDPNVCGGGSRNILPLLDRAGSGFGEDRVAPGNLHVVHGTVRIDNDIQTDKSSDGGSLEVRGIDGCDLGDDFSTAHCLVEFLRAQHGVDAGERKGKSQDEHTEQVRRNVWFHEEAGWFHSQQFGAMG
jgi:hypothetical protein